jgi:hypothetical protein
MSYREAVIDFHLAIVSYGQKDERLEDLEKLMLSAYSLSRLIRNKWLMISNPNMTGTDQSIDALINKCMTLIDRPGVDPLVQANVLEMLSRKAFSVLRKERYNVG